MIMNPPIFIHGLFRSNSTYFLNKFDLNNYCCFCEPLHGNLHTVRSIKKPSYKNVTNLKHNDFIKENNIDLYIKNYTYNSKSKKILNFKREFIFFDFELQKEKEASDFKKYIDSLIEISILKNQTPVLKFVRSTLRIEWLDHNYNPLNIFLIRDPKDQWCSIKGVSICYFMSFFINVIKHSNNSSGLLNPLKEKYNNELKNKTLTDLENYYIFYYFWKLFEKIIYNIDSNKIIIETNNFSNSTYRDDVMKKLLDKNLHIDFEDFKYKKYELNDNIINSYNEVESEINNIIKNL